MNKSQHVQAVIDAHPDVVSHIEYARARKGKVKITLEDAKRIAAGVAPVLLASDSGKAIGPDGDKRGTFALRRVANSGG